MAKAITVSYSELDTARQCLKKHEYGYKLRFQAPETGPALSKGILWHEVMETHYKMIKYWQDEHQPGEIVFGDEMLGFEEALMRQVMSVLYEQGQPRSEWSELVEWMYRGHVEQYGIDPDWRILAVEHAPLMWLPTPRGGRSRFRIKMKIDLIVRWNGKIWIVDHKSGKDLPKDKELDIDDQFGLYTWGLRKMGKKVFGQVHSAARTHRNKDQDKHPQPLDERFRRTRLFRSDDELETIAVEAYRYARVAYSHPIGEAPRSPNPDTCRWRCDFTEACMMGRKTDDARMREMLESMGFTRNLERH